MKAFFMDMSQLTWTCQICGQRRPDDRISVITTDISKKNGLPVGTVGQNVRYCNDNPDCEQKAQTKML